MRVPTFVWLLCDDATTKKGRECDKGTNLGKRNFAVVPLMPTGILVATCHLLITIGNSLDPDQDGHSAHLDLHPNRLTF